MKILRFIAFQNQFSIFVHTTNACYNCIHKFEVFVARFVDVFEIKLFAIDDFLCNNCKKNSSAPKVNSCVTRIIFDIF